MHANRARHPWKSLAIASFVFVLAFGAFVSIAPPASAATIYKYGPTAPGEIWFSGDTYVLIGHVTVPFGRSLTIQPGAIVKMDPLRALYVEGRLSADGLPGNLILVQANNTLSLFPYIGIQFNATSGGSVSWSSFERPWSAVIATDSNPAIHNNTVRNADRGFHLMRSGSVVADNSVNRGNWGIWADQSDALIVRNAINGTGTGIHLERSDAWVEANSINATALGIEVTVSGAPTILSNTVTNVSDSFAVGIFVDGVAGVEPNPQVVSNTIRDVRGKDGANGNIFSIDGAPGGIAAGIVVSGGASVTVSGNTIDGLYGGRGGNGYLNVSGKGGRGGEGGSAAGIVTVAASSVSMDFNSIANVSGGPGGTGGGSAATSSGGEGGPGGDVFGIQVQYATLSAGWFGNTIGGLLGGAGGHGGDAILDGNGTGGGDGIGLFSINANAGDASWNWISSITGGPGGSSLASGAGTGLGGPGGGATGIIAFGIGSSASYHSNAIWIVTGGLGGRGRMGGGTGGNASGVVVLGSADGYYNETTVTGGSIFSILGGDGGRGEDRGGSGGSASGVTLGFVTAISGYNWIGALVGGAGGDGVVGTAGRGGDAGGMGLFYVPSMISTNDTIDTAASGLPGAGPAPGPSYGVGLFFQGSLGAPTRATLDNGTILSASDFDLYLDNYSEVTTINTTAVAAANVEAASNLTIRNYLGVDVLWPDASTLVTGSSILVEDDGVPAWDIVSGTGKERWLLVTDRVYEGQDLATDHSTDVTVTYGAEPFSANPRSVDMGSSRVEPFVMVDRFEPTSAASGLPTFTTSLSFAVNYSADDGAGVGLANITLYYRPAGSGGWTPGATVPAAGSGSIPFVAPSDGTWEFATSAEDGASNAEPLPAGNDTWTIVDTTSPGSRVDPLPTWQTSASFAVSWAPDVGVADIATFSVQYNRGSGWTDWRVNVTTTSDTFTGATAGVYQFRSIAYDFAGNVEIAPASNDTWTIVDLARPFSRVTALPVFETTLAYLVSWGPQFDTFDIASYRVEVNDNGGGWVAWYAAATNTSALFAGTDGHTYQFRSVATDFAGNVETAPAGNDTWTIVDVTPPSSAVANLPSYESSLSFTISWGPVGGTTDITSYTVQVSDNGGAFATIPGLAGTSSTSATFVGTDGHRYAFRSLAQDAAGNVEPAPAGNDTWTIVDVTRPTVTNRAPLGSNVNLTPVITITFSEPMDRASVEQAFSVTPSMDGSFSWSADSRVLTFVPSRALNPGTDYFVVVDTGARDLAGNLLVSSATLQFTTVAAGVGVSFGDLWWLLLVVAAAGGAAFFLLMRRRAAPSSATKAVPASAAAKADDQAVIDDVFLLHHRDGLLIKHETRRLKPDVDTDILSGMLTAVQQFVKDSFRSEEGELDELTFGQMHILIGRGKWLIVATMVTGGSTVAFSEQIQQAIKDMEDHHWDQLEDWDGDMVLAKVLAPYLKKLIRGDYA